MGGSFIIKKYVNFQFRVGLDKCWGSTSADAYDTNGAVKKFIFFDNKCPVDGLPWVKAIDTNANRKVVELRQFAFTGQADKSAFYYHCEVIIALSRM